jgi:lysine-N-methylase
LNNNEHILGIKELESFKCVGSECEDTCCAGWGVSIDKFTHAKWESEDKYKSIRQHLSIIPTSERNGIDTANIIITDSETKKCPFLNQEKLCEIQKNHGHESLSYTCRSFPRSRNSLFNIKEENMSLACPEAARLVLNSKKPLEIKLLDNPVDEINLIKSIYPVPNELCCFSSETAWELRSLVLKIIQTQGIEISNRLILIGMFAKNLEDAVVTSNHEESNIKKVIKNYQEISKSKEQIVYLTQNIPKSTEIKFIFLRNLISKIEQYAKSNQKYLIYFDKLKKAYRFSESNNDKFLLENYLELRQKYLNSSFQKQIFENYIFHLFVKEMFPFGSKKILTQFQEIIVRIFLVQEHLISLSKTSEEFNEANIIKLIQSFTRTYEHSSLFQTDLNQMLETLNFSSLAHICILLQD